MEENDSAPPRLVKAGGGYSVIYKNRHLYDRISPANRASLKASAIDLISDTLVVVPSPLLFYGTETIREKLPGRSKILYLEYDENLYNLKNCETSLYSSDSEYLLIKDPSFLLGYFEQQNCSPVRNIILLPVNSGYLLHKDFYLECLENLKKSHRQSLKNTLTLYALGHRYYKNLFLNIPEFLAGKNISELEIDSPVVVTGAGESLEAALPLLSKYREDIKILAIDTSLKTLTNYNILPDFVIAVESQFYNIADFHGNSNSAIRLIADITSYPQTSRLFRGEKYFFTSRFKSSSFLDRVSDLNLIPSFIPPLGSVGLTALYLSRVLTCRPVFYAGLDFSFVPGKTHAKDTPPLINQQIHSTRLSGMTNYYLSISGTSVTVSSQSGSTVYTTPVLKNYSETMKEILDNDRAIYSLFSCGIVENKNNITDEKTFRQIISDKTIWNETRTSIGKRNKTDYGAALNFLYSEKKNIDSIIDCGVNILNNIDKGKNTRVLADMLEYTDYLNPVFGPSAVTLKETATVKNILLSCYKFRKAINNAIRIILHQS